MIRPSLICALVLLAGCTDPGPQIVPVKGTVKYSDGTVPTGEIAIVRFQPTRVVNADGTNAGAELKAASGDIQPDGSFQLTTDNPGDGAYEGDFKVVVTIWKSYAKREPVVPQKYADLATTPWTAQVKPGAANEFHFVIEKP